jgi:hypothetical protein
VGRRLLPDSAYWGWQVMGVWDEKTLNASMPIEDFGLDVLRGAHIVVRAESGRGEGGECGRE